MTADREPSISWRDYVESRFASQETAVKVALDELRHRLEEMNRFREENRRQAQSMVSRELFDSTVQGLRTEVATERSARLRSEGSVAAWRFLASFLGVSGVVGVILGLLAVFSP